jgi:Pyruvate/2-oxoacid:ferredoxin oxidoreductase delta subunit
MLLGKMPYVTIQTVKFIKNGVSKLLDQMMCCPELPDGVENIELEDCSIVEKNILGTTHTFPNGTSYFFMAKPVMKDALVCPPIGAYYKFCNNGSVTLRLNDETYNWVYKDIPLIGCRICGSECEGGDYEDWSFCSRACMVDYSRD